MSVSKLSDRLNELVAAATEHIKDEMEEVLDRELAKIKASTMVQMCQHIRVIQEVDQMGGFSIRVVFEDSK